MFVDHSGPRAEYFLNIQEALRRQGLASPVLVIDRERLNANLEFLKKDVPDSLAGRLVSKSLPCLPLLQHAREVLGTDRLMTFNLPMLIDIARAMPDANQMLGKPLPVAAAKQFYSEDLQPSALSGVHWLVDTLPRLGEYEDLATSLDRPLDLVLELDIGLHRGGFDPGPELVEALKRIRMKRIRHAQLRFAGLMGYEAHLAKVPTLGGWRAHQVARAGALYRQANDMAAEVLGDEAVAQTLRNVAGSPTYRFYRDDSIANEISIGSALVKPTDFDTDLLEPYQPALFIATPALKVLRQTRIPVLEFFDRLKRWLDPDLAQAIFIHGGYWKALPVDPPGMRLNATYGRSTNQELLNVGARAEIKADDFVFLRPTQSEAVMLQFGKIAVYENREIRDIWKTLPASA